MHHLIIISTECEAPWGFGGGVGYQNGFPIRNRFVAVQEDMEIKVTVVLISCEVSKHDLPKLHT